ncbi:MAG: hypothetical protein SOZ84_01465 [Treponema sp.]|nr:hypothetical protein [Treponema sp.]
MIRFHDTAEKKDIMIDKNFDREHLLVDTTKCVLIDFSNAIDFSNDKKELKNKYKSLRM